MWDLRDWSQRWLGFGDQHQPALSHQWQEWWENPVRWQRSASILEVSMAELESVARHAPPKLIWGLVMSFVDFDCVTLQKRYIAAQVQ